MNSRPRHATSTAKTTARGSRPVAVEEAEAALVEHYPRLVRLAYLTLPAALGKHRRVVVAHRLAQRALPRSGRAAAAPGGAYGLLRREVLRGALEFGGRGRLRTALDGARGPHVLGLRVHPRMGDDAELALDRALSALPPQARAAFALRIAEQVNATQTQTLLEEAGVDDPAAALRKAASAAAGHSLPELRRFMEAPEFDPATVQARPTDLLRRRRRTRVGLAATIVLTVCAALVAVDSDTPPTTAYTAGGGPPAAGAPLDLDPAALVRTAPGGWTATTRLDFTAWPPRGGRTGDKALLRRALSVWAAPGPAVDITSTPGTPRTGPAQPPQLLFAGDTGSAGATGQPGGPAGAAGSAGSVATAGATVVLFYDGLRLVRYAQPRAGGGRAALDFAQVQNADIATAAAVVLDRGAGRTRYLLAPWVTGARTRDLMRPDRAGTEVRRTADGVTDPVPVPVPHGGGPSTSPGSRPASPAAGCGTTWPVLQLRASSEVAEKHSFLLTDLGDLTPVHLTFVPPPGADPQDGSPREATGRQALTSWAHDACGLGALRGQGVRSVNDWQFARTALPEGDGRAAWTCDRVDTWRGPGQATVRFVPPTVGATAPGVLAGQQTDGHACSRFGPDVLAGVLWKSHAGHWYLLAAGSRRVARITAAHGVDATANGPHLAVRAARGDRPTLTGTLTTGGTLAPLSDG